MIKYYVPDVYRRYLDDIDFNKLKEKGIKLISFDIDETIIPKAKKSVSVDLIPIFNTLKQDFCIVLISNNSPSRTKKVAEDLGVYPVKKDDSSAKKPSDKQFNAARDYYKRVYGEELQYSEMAHVGDSLCNDVAGAKSLGITACLVRKVGDRKQKKDNHQISYILSVRGLWNKHHKYEEDDEFYQLGEKQTISENFPL